MWFEWDNGNISKILARFDLHEVEKFFFQELLVIEDDLHSGKEKRFIAVGDGPNKKPMFVCFTIRDRNIRVISARFMRGKEAKKYEKFKKDIEEKE